MREVFLDEIVRLWSHTRLRREIRRLDRILSSKHKTEHDPHILRLYLAEAQRRGMAIEIREE